MKIGMRNKRGVFFSTDAMIAMFILLLVLIVAFPPRQGIRYETEVHQDILKSLSILKVGESSNPYVQGLIASGDITDLDKSLLEQIGELYVVDPDDARVLISAVLGDLNLKGNVGIWYGSTLIYSSNSTPIEDAIDIDVSRQILSGIESGGNVTGFSARAFLSSDSVSNYFYFGGYVGDGDVSFSVPYTGTISDARIELVINDNFDLYVNGIFQGNFLGSPDDFTPVNYTLQAGDFISGDNLVEFKGTNLHIAGGFLKVTYMAEVEYSEAEKYRFPGIEGLVNLYDGFYVPGTLTTLDIFLHLNSSVNAFLNIGNVSVFNGTTDGEEYISISDAMLSTLLDYDMLSEETIPVRLGLENVSYGGINQKVDVFSVTDLSGSMDDNCNPSSCEYSCGSCGGACGICDAKAGNDILIDVILNTTGSRVGLVGYETSVRESDVHVLSSDDVSLKDLVLNEWDASGSTCICCGINRAIFELNSGTIHSRISTGNDDAEQCTDDGDMSLGSGDLEMIKDTGRCGGGGDQEVGMRFQNIYIPQGSNILSAYIEFTADASDSGNTNLVLHAEDIDNAPQFSNSDYDITSRTKTSGSVNWNNLQSWSINIGYNSPELSLIVQEVIDRPGWNTGNSIVIIVSGSGQREAESYNGETYSAARLIVTHQPPLCGNGADDPGEECDDGNAINNDGCSIICEVEESVKNMIVLSDGQANRQCPQQDTGSSSQDAIDAACDAYELGINVHAIGFGGSVDETTLQAIAQCGNGSYFFADVDELADIYQQIANNILAEYSEQTLGAFGDFYTRLYPDSYVEFGYVPQEIPPGLILTLENQFSNSSGVSFSVPDDVTIVETRITSYSGPRWTDNVKIGENDVYDLSNYGSEYIVLGDPYIVNIPDSLVLPGTQNDVTLTTAVSPTNSSEGSIFNKVLLTLVKNATAFSDIKVSANGCHWTIEFEDGDIIEGNIPEEYSGGDMCNYISSDFGDVANENDAMQVAVLSLLQDLDIDSDGRLDFLFSEEDLQVSLDQVTGIPFTWTSEVQARRWY
jgi:cysteine-rich repeat protein